MRHTSFVKLRNQRSPQSQDYTSNDSSGEFGYFARVTYFENKDTSGQSTFPNLKPVDDKVVEFDAADIQDARVNLEHIIFEDLKDQIHPDVEVKSGAHNTVDYGIVEFEYRTEKRQELRSSGQVTYRFKADVPDDSSKHLRSRNRSKY